MRQHNIFGLKKPIVSILSIVTILTTTSCNDWLDLLPNNEQVTDNYWQTKEDVESVIASGYYYMRNAVPQMKGQSLIDDFINIDKGRFTLSDDPLSPPIIDETPETNENEGNEGVFTETLARIYIKQGKYSQALEIIQRLSLVYPKKNAYFADQIRFLKKLHRSSSRADDWHRAHPGV